MNNPVLYTLTAGILLTCSVKGIAANIDITASYSTSTDAEGKNIFTNTTSTTGDVCERLFFGCRSDYNKGSIPMGITATRNGRWAPHNSDRRAIYFKMPAAWRDITVTNPKTGQSSELRFRVSDFAATMYWSSLVMLMAPLPPCLSADGTHNAKNVSFKWAWPNNDIACTTLASKTFLGKPQSIEKTAIFYELQTPDPLKMESGIYTGILPLTVGPGGEVDFGDAFDVSDNELNIRFTLTVTHELKVTPIMPDDREVTLQPCAIGRVCTEDEGQANWERWMVTRATPELTGRSHFGLSSSGTFMVYLECGQQSGSDCALQSDKVPSQIVPIQTFLTLPENVIDKTTGMTVSKRRLFAGRDVKENIFVSNNYSRNRPGSIDFFVRRKDVDTMLKTRPDTYWGTVTIIFDPDL